MPNAMSTPSTRGTTVVRPRNDGARRLRHRRRATRMKTIGATRNDDDNDAIGRVFSKLYKENSTGKSIVYGVFQRDVDENDRVSDDEAASRRAEAARTLTNIDAKERQRRMNVGLVAWALTATLVATQTLTHAPRIERLAVVVPLFFALGFVGSAKSGL